MVRRRRVFRDGGMGDAITNYSFRYYNGGGLYLDSSGAVAVVCGGGWST